MSDPAEPRLIASGANAAGKVIRRWTTTWHDKDGHRRTKRFGREGRVAGTLAKARFRHWYETEYRKSKRLQGIEAAEYTVGDLVDAYLEHAKTIFIRDGEETTHLGNVRLAMEALKSHHGETPAYRLEAPHIVALRDAMIHGTSEARGSYVRSVKTVNGRLQCIKSAFAWARERGLIPSAVAYDVAMVKPVKSGRTAANEARLITPVAEQLVKDAMATASPTIRAMIEVQWWTGMRSGELCRMRPCDIETGGKVWVYRPARHKSDRKGKRREIPLGPKAQAIIQPLMTRDLDSYLFRPDETVAAMRAERSAARKTPVNAGNSAGSNRKADPQVQPGEAYSAGSYRKAVATACAKANIVPPWIPLQIRHAWATRVRKLFGIEEASVGLGHSQLSTTEIYAERSLEKAKDVARRVG